MAKSYVDRSSSSDEHAKHGYCSSDRLDSGVRLNPTACTNRALDATFEEGLGEWFEARNLAVDDPWGTYNISLTLSYPVIIAKPLSYGGKQPAHTRIRRIGRGSRDFDCRVEEWEYEDDSHLEESVGSLAIDGGRRGNDDYSEFLEAGYKPGVDENWGQITYYGSNNTDDGFSTTPVVFTQAQTVNGKQAIVTRNQNVDGHSFDVRVQEEESNGAHTKERIGWLAIEPGVGHLNGQRYETDVIVNQVNDSWHQINFNNSYTNPVFLADMQTFNGPDPCGMRYQNLSGSSVEVKIEEEQSTTKETTHLEEDVGYFVIESS